MGVRHDFAVSPKSLDPWIRGLHPCIRERKRLVPPSRGEAVRESPGQEFHRESPSLYYRQVGGQIQAQASRQVGR